jgi:S1-C subfamily serine protease
MIDFGCPRCGTMQRVPDAAAGHKVSCAKCGQRLKVPESPEMQTMAAVMAPPKAAEARAGAKVGKQWFYQDGGKQCGPVTWTELRRMAAEGELSPEDRVWSEGMAKWQLARTIPNLFPKPPRDTAPEPAAEGGTGKWLEGCGVLIFGGLAGLALLAFVGFLIYRGVYKKSDGGDVAAATQADKELTTEQIVERCKPLVALVKSDLGHGTGFLAAPGIVVTNSHVVADGPGEKLHVLFPSAGESGKTPLPVELLYEDAKRDLAILRINSSASPLNIMDKYEVKGGEKVVVIGNPAASAGEDVTLENAVTPGTMSTQTTLNGLGFYQINASINPGNSGGPLLDSRGQVIGVITRKAIGDRQEGMGFAIPVADLHQALRKVEGQSKADAAHQASHHDVVAVFHRLVEAGRVQTASMSHYSKRMQEAIADKRNAQEGWDQAKSEIDAKLKPEAMDQVLIGNIRASIPRILADPNLPETTRKGMDNLLGAYTEMRQWLGMPKDANTFADKTAELKNRFDQQIELLQTPLGVE